MISERFVFLLASLAGSFLAASFFASVKIIFSAIAGSYIPPSAERLRHFSPKIGAILDEKERFSLTVSSGKLFFNTLFAVLLFIIIQGTLRPAGAFTAALVSFCLSLAVLGLLANIIPRT
jgi:hypothetical protein